MLRNATGHLLAIIGALCGGACGFGVIFLMSGLGFSIDQPHYNVYKAVLETGMALVVIFVGGGASYFIFRTALPRHFPKVDRWWSRRVN